MIRAAATSDLLVITALYGREMRDGTATFELDPPSIEAMNSRFAAPTTFGRDLTGGLA